MAAEKKNKSNKGRNIAIGSGIGLFFIALLAAGVKRKKDKDFDTKINTIKSKNVMNLQLLDYIKKYFKRTPFKTTGNLDNDLVAFTLLEEGGLTDNPKDSASKDPVPVTWTWKVYGKPHTGKPHTNFGITWTAFKKHFGESVAPERFLNMSHADWLAVFNQDYIKPFSKFSNNKLINYELGLWAWGSGVGGATQSIKKFIDENGPLQTLINTDKADAFEKIILHRIKFFQSIVTPKPTDTPEQLETRKKNAGFLPVWINRSLNFYDNFKQYV